MRPARSVRVRVPATSANLGPGFDCLGLALQLYDEVTVQLTGSGLDVAIAGEGASELPRDSAHLVARALRAGAERLGFPLPGLRLRAVNAIPQGRGLGSSAAAVVAGLMAARALHPNGPASLPDHELLAMAAAFEGHPDNVAACLLGGLTLAWMDDGVANAVRLDVHPDISVTLLVPPATLSTGLARGMLPAQVPHAEAARTAGRTGLLVHALTGAPQLLLSATADWLHQQYREPAMPDTGRLIDRLRARGVPAVLSGAGPAVAAFTDGPLAADVPGGWTVYQLAVATEGAEVMALQ